MRTRRGFFQVIIGAFTGVFAPRPKVDLTASALQFHPNTLFLSWPTGEFGRTGEKIGATIMVRKPMRFSVKRPARFDAQGRDLWSEARRNNYR